MRSRVWSAACTGLVAWGLLTGCCRRYDIAISADETLRDVTGTLPSVEVHIVAINHVEYPTWYNYSIDKYWSVGDKLRADAERFRYLMKFGQGQPVSQVLSKEDPIWKQWEAKQPICLVVMAFVPGVSDDRPGNSGRRLLLPLDGDCWENCRRPLKFLIGRSGLRCLTPPKAKKDCLPAPTGFGR